MPFTTDQLIRGADYTIKTFDKKDPIDQVNLKHTTLDWLISNKVASTYGNGSFKEPIYVDNGSNTQPYFGADQVTYNERDPARWTDFTYFNYHDGFWLDEDRLLQNEISMSDDGGAVPSAGEKERLINLLETSHLALKLGHQEYLAFETLRDGSQSTKSVPGLAHIIDPSPATGIVGGINAATSTYWQNNANLAFSAANIVTEMEETWKDCMRFGGKLPTAIRCGRAYYEAYGAAASTAVQRHMTVMGKGATTMDASIGDLNFHGIPLVWDPTFEALDTLLSTTTQTKTAYFLNDSVKLRPVKGEWMRTRKPDKLPDRYVWYFGKTSKFGITANKRNSLAVLSIS